MIKIAQHMFPRTLQQWSIREELPLSLNIKECAKHRQLSTRNRIFQKNEKRFPNQKVVFQPMCFKEKKLPKRSC